MIDSESLVFRSNSVSAFNMIMISHNIKIVPVPYENMHKLKYEIYIII